MCLPEDAVDGRGKVVHFGCPLTGHFSPLHEGVLIEQFVVDPSNSADENLARAPEQPCSCGGGSVYGRGLHGR